VGFLVGRLGLGLLGLICPSGWAHILGEGFLARDASVVVVVVIHHLKIVSDWLKVTRKSYSHSPFKYGAVILPALQVHLIHTRTETHLVKAGVSIPQADARIREDFLAGCAVANLAQGAGDEFKVAAGEVETLDFFGR
jgi:hypothetical protein